jgi:regulatory protein
VGRAVRQATGNSSDGRAGRPRAGSVPAPAAPAVPDDSDSPDASPGEIARLICLRMLTAAPRTRAELAAALHRRGVPAQAAQTVLERFADVQLIDDAMFARAWVDSRHHGRGLARRALAAELRRRGVAATDIEAAVDQLDPEQELATARDLVTRRLASTRSLPAPARFRRLMGMLARKGYPEGLAYRVVREAINHEPPDYDPSDQPESDLTELSGSGSPQEADS